MEEVAAANREAVNEFSEQVLAAPFVFVDQELRNELSESLDFSRLSEIRKFQKITSPGIPTIISLEQGVMKEAVWVQLLQTVSLAFNSNMKKRTLCCCALEDEAGNITKLYVALSGRQSIPLSAQAQLNVPVVFCPAVQNTNAEHNRTHDWLFLMGRMYNSYNNKLNELISDDETTESRLIKIREYISELKDRVATTVQDEPIFSDAYAFYKRSTEEKCNESWHTTCETELLILDEVNFLIRVALVDHATFDTSCRALLNSNVPISPVHRKVFRNWHNFLLARYRTKFSKLKEKFSLLMDEFQQLSLDFIYTIIMKPCAEDNMLSALRGDIEAVRKATVVKFVSLYKTRHGRSTDPISEDTIANSVIPLCIGCLTHFYYDLSYALAYPSSTTSFSYRRLIEGSSPEGLPSTVHNLCKDDVDIVK